MSAIEFRASCATCRHAPHPRQRRGRCLECDDSSLSMWEPQGGALGRDDQAGGSAPSQYALPDGSAELQDNNNDNVDHPKHYTSHPSGIECIQITEHMNFCLGNAFKYLWRCGLKNNEIDDLKKAAWYIEREIQRREARASN